VSSGFDQTIQDAARANASRDSDAETDTEAGAVLEGAQATFAAMGGWRTTYYVQDAVVPHGARGGSLKRINQLRQRMRVTETSSRLRRRQPTLVLYDVATIRARAEAEDLTSSHHDDSPEHGSLTGEHGIRRDKMNICRRCYRGHGPPCSFCGAPSTRTTSCGPAKIFPITPLRQKPDLPHAGQKADLAENFWEASYMW